MSKRKKRNNTIRFRKISPSMWDDATFRELSPIPPCGQGLWIYLLTNPDTTNIPGCYRSTEASMADILGWKLAGFRKAWRQVAGKGLARANWGARFVWVPNAIKYNLPESPNVVLSWRSAWSQLPDCDLKAEAWHTLNKAVGNLTESFRAAFREACPQPSATCPGSRSRSRSSSREQGAVAESNSREQQQQQEQLILARSCDKHSPEPPVPAVIIIPLVGTDEHQVSQADVDEWTQAFPAVDVMQELRNIRQWCLANPKQRKTAVGAKRFITSWLTRSQNKGGSRRLAGGSSQQSTFRQVTEELMRDAYEYDRDHQEGICGPDVKAKGALPEPSH